MLLHHASGGVAVCIGQTKLAILFGTAILVVVGNISSDILTCYLDMLYMFKYSSTNSYFGAQCRIPLPWDIGL